MQFVKFKTATKTNNATRHGFLRKIICSSQPGEQVSCFLITTSDVIPTISDEYLNKVQITFEDYQDHVQGDEVLISPTDEKRTLRLSYIYLEE